MSGGGRVNQGDQLGVVQGSNDCILDSAVAKGMESSGLMQGLFERYNCQDLLINCLEGMRKREI